MGNERVRRLVDEICSMNLLEVADLTELLRKRLGITAPGPGMYAMGKFLIITRASAPVVLALAHVQCGKLCSADS